MIRQRYSILLAALLPGAWCIYAAGGEERLPDTTAVVHEADDRAAKTHHAADSTVEIPTVSGTTKEKDPGGRTLVVVKKDLDTVFIFDKAVFRHVASDWRNNIGIFRRRGYGMSGSSHHGANAIFIGPVRELAENDPFLARRNFNFSRFSFEPFLMSGGSGYVGLGDGFRLGGGGMGGERKFSSGRFGGDSLLVLTAQVGYGGFLIEKCMVWERWNLTFGALLGAGSMKVSVAEQANNWFNRQEIYGDDDRMSESAAFMLLQPQCGFSYTFLYFFHVGASVTMPAFMSIEKFNAYTNDFFTVNPGLRIQLIFGNLG